MAQVLLSSVQAADPAVTQRVDTRSIPTPVFLVYDTNHNGFLESAEIDAIRQAYRKDLNSKLLKQYDIDSNEELSNAEIAAIPYAVTITEPLPQIEALSKQKGLASSDKKGQLSATDAASSAGGLKKIPNTGRVVFVQPRRYNDRNYNNRYNDNGYNNGYNSGYNNRRRR
jgi:hypothetical protein